MRHIARCPVCCGINRTLVFERKILDTFGNLEGHLLDIDYVRNWILFRRILHGSRDSIEISFYLCRACGLIYFSPRPEDSDMRIKYRLVNDLGDTLRREQHRLLVSQKDRRARQIYERITRSRPLNSGSRILDLGGADGANLKYFRPDMECHVVDYEKRRLIPGTEHVGQCVEDVLEQPKYDVVLICHTVEHMVDPCKELERAFAILKDRGLVYVEVPYGCGGEYSRTRNVLTHVNFFSTGSLGFLLERTGFRVEESKAQPTLTSTRYLPVVVGIGTKPKAGESIEPRFAGSAYSITRQEMSKSLAAKTFFANARLFMRSPFAYLRVLPDLVSRIIGKVLRT